MKKCVPVILLFAVFSFAAEAQQTLTIDKAITRAVNQVGVIIPRQAKVAVLSYESPSKAFSDYLGDTLTYELQTKMLRNVVSYNNVDSLRKDYNIEASYISDAKAAEIGKALGVDLVILVKVLNAGAIYQMNVQALNITPAKKINPVRYYLSGDAVLAELVKEPPVTDDSAAPTESVIRRLRANRDLQENS
ncbi:hypothetical protein FACS189494_03430 [Spirochaetia bacterium]|nr:hypothetical protein FACS189494_03430 [Spirochaetia bacterium]